MGTGHAQRVGIPLHDGTPGLGPLVHGDTPGHGTGDLRVAVVDGSGADHQIAVPQVFGVVADGHGDAQGPEVADRVALRHVGALDMEAHAPQHLRQGAHGHAADAHQMGPLAGDDIVADGMEIVHHEKTPYLKRTASAPLMILWEYHEVAQKPAIPYQIFHYSMRRRKMQPEKSRAPFQDQRWRPQFRRLHQTERSRKRKVICRIPVAALRNLPVWIRAAGINKSCLPQKKEAKSRLHSLNANVNIRCLRKQAVSRTMALTRKEFIPYVM